MSSESLGRGVAVVDNDELEIEMGSGDEYKEWIAEVFSGSAKTFGSVGDGFFQFVGSELVSFAGVESGMTVLDVACGRGSSLYPLVERVGSAGEVVGIDISATMINELKKDLDADGITNAKAITMDAENLDFPDQSFDAAVCGLGLFFMPNSDRAVAEIARVLRPGGRFTCSTFLEAETPFTDGIGELASTYRERLAPVPEAETDDLETVESVADLLKRNGFSDMSTSTSERRIEFGSIEQFWDWMWSHGGREFLTRFSKDDLAAFMLEAKAYADEWLLKGPIEVVHRMLFTRGTT